MSVPGGTTAYQAYQKIKIKIKISMDNAGNTAPESSTPSGRGILADVTNLTAAEVRRKRERERYASLSADQKKAEVKNNRESRQRNKEATTSLTGSNLNKQTPISVDINDVESSRPCNVSIPHTAIVTGTLADVTNLSPLELKRKRQIEWYASLSAEQKQARQQKNREYRKRSKEPATPLTDEVTLDGNVTNLTAAQLSNYRARKRYNALSGDQKEARLQQMRDNYHRRKRNMTFTSISENESDQLPITPRRLSFADNTGIESSQPVFTPRRLPFSWNMMEISNTQTSDIVDHTTEDNNVVVDISGQNSGNETHQPIGVVMNEATISEHSDDDDDESFLMRGQEGDPPGRGDVSKYLSLLYVVSEMGAQDLIGGLSSYVKSIDSASTLENVWVTSSKPYLIRLTVKKLRLILMEDTRIGQDCFNLAVRSFAYQDVHTDGTVPKHCMDLRFWISLGFARGKAYHKEPTNAELFMYASSWPECGYDVSCCNSGKKLFILDPKPVSDAYSRNPAGPDSRKIMCISDNLMKAWGRCGWAEDLMQWEHVFPDIPHEDQTLSGYLVYLFMRKWSNGELKLPAYKVGTFVSICSLKISASVEYDENKPMVGDGSEGSITSKFNEKTYSGQSLRTTGQPMQWGIISFNHDRASVSSDKYIVKDLNGPLNGLSQPFVQKPKQAQCTWIQNNSNNNQRRHQSIKQWQQRQRPGSQLWLLVDSFLSPSLSST
uniref:Uncharacterized protein n=1 Tax=Leersia perrieri TaxID=77586 RepID=A0A0D9WX72_9ORYZ